MFGRLLSALWPPSRRPSPDPRLVFEFWAGGRRRVVDPDLVWADLARDLGGDLEEMLRVVAGGGREAIGVAVRVADAAARAFGVEPFRDGRGMTVRERIELVGAFLGHTRAAGTATPTGRRMTTPGRWGPGGLRGRRTRRPNRGL